MGAVAEITKLYNSTVNISTKPEYNWIDYAKGLGIVLVVYGHIARGLMNANLIGHPFFELVDSIIYTFHMPIFFFISGYLFYVSLLKKRLSIVSFKKLDSIIYVYLVWSILQTVIESSLSSFTNGSVRIDELYQIGMHPRAQFWFLYALFLVVLVFSLMLKFFGKNIKLISVVFGVLIYLVNVYYLNGFIYWMLCNHFVYFSIGYALASFFIKYDGEFSSGASDSFGRIVKAMVVFSCFFLLSQYYFHGHMNYTYFDRGVLSFVVALISLIFIFSLSVLLSRINIKSLRMIGYIGKYSLYIYLMHIVVGSGVRIILDKLMFIDSVYVHILLGFSLAICIPIFIARAASGNVMELIFFGSFNGLYNKFSNHAEALK